MKSEVIMYRVYIDDNNVFGPFDTHDEAQEWVDDNCGYATWEIIKGNEEPKRQSLPALNPEEFQE
tara:strand:- start:102 stop:296 length:195 start_codon:yes stop_codon:yes gene_type:complete